MANLFGTLNRFISRLDSDPSLNTTQSSAPSHHQANHYGFQVLRNMNPSTVPLDPWFDFIIGLNGHNISHPDPQLLVAEVRNCAGSTISLGVYSAKGSQIREIYVTVPPSTEPSSPLLGLTLQWSPLQLSEEVWHVLDVMADSPADLAGLLPYSDYVIGSPDAGATPLHGSTGLGALIERSLDRPLRLYVYNQEYDVTRLLSLTPSRDWGGEGSLGCVLGYGALHRLPAPLGEPAQAPGETLFESDPAPASAPQAGGVVGGGDFFVPAASAASLPPPPPPPAASGGKPRKARATHAPSAGLDDYFAEGEQKSRELEGSTSSSTSKTKGGLPPPPPKAGGPPKAASPLPATAVEETDAVATEA